MAEAEHPVFDQHGRQIGTVKRVRLGRNRAEFWDARSLDGVDLGAHRQRDDAHLAIQDDWERGRPRNSKDRRQRWRPIIDSEGPVYLGNA